MNELIDMPEKMVLIDNTMHGSIDVWTDGATFRLPCIFCKLDGFEEFQFAAHKAVNATDDWTVSECTKGFVVRHGDDLDSALANAAAQLRYVGVDGLRKALEKADKMIAERLPAIATVK